tara:strand:- start:818 stop:1033 length:216 start_codon:yes stop_codon:yes gene_type:complete
MKEPLAISVLIPLVSVIVLLVFAVGLGIIFLYLDGLHWDKWDIPWGVVGLGMILTVGVPSIAALLQSRLKE